MTEQFELALPFVIATKAQYRRILLRYIESKPPMTLRELQKTVNNPDIDFEQRLRLKASLSGDMLAMVRADKLTVTHAIYLARLPKDEQCKFLAPALLYGKAAWLPRLIERAKQLAAATKSVVTTPAATKAVVEQVTDEMPFPVLHGKATATYSKQLYEYFAIYSTMTVPEVLSSQDCPPLRKVINTWYTGMSSYVSTLMWRGKLSIRRCLLLRRLPKTEQDALAEAALTERIDVFAKTVLMRSQEIRTASPPRATKPKLNKSSSKSVTKKVKNRATP